MTSPVTEGWKVRKASAPEENRLACRKELGKASRAMGQQAPQRWGPRLL